MRCALLAIGAIATGCYSDRGLAIDVDVRVEMKDAPTTVELFIGNRRCAGDNAGGIKCEAGLAPPGIKNQLAANGGVWFRDDVVPFIAEVRGHTATFRLQAGDADADVALELAILVGKIDDQIIGVSTLTNLTVPVDDALIVSTQLTKADGISATSNTAGNEERVAVWGDDAHTCVGIEHWTGGNATRQFIVPEDDPDCDGLELARECNPAAYLGSLPPGAASRPNCVTDAAEPDVSIGSRGCVDRGADPVAACTAITPRVCMADSFAGCTFAPSPMACADRVLADTPKLQCTLPAREDIFSLCLGRQPTTVDLSERLGGRCNGSAKIGTLQLTGFDSHHDFNGSTIEVALKSDCQLEIGWTDGSHAGGAGTDRGMIALPNAVGGGLMLPVELKFLPGRCMVGEEIQCTLDPHPDDGLWDCATPVLE